MCGLAGLASDLSCTDSTRAYCLDAEYQPTDLAVWGFESPAARQTCRPDGLKQEWRCSAASGSVILSAKWRLQRARLLRCLDRIEQGSVVGLEDPLSEGP